MNAEETEMDENSDKVLQMLPALTEPSKKELDKGDDRADVTKEHNGQTKSTGADFLEERMGCKVECFGTKELERRSRYSTDHDQENEERCVSEQNGKKQEEPGKCGHVLLKKHSKEQPGNTDQQTDELTFSPTQRAEHILNENTSSKEKQDTVVDLKNSGSFPDLEKNLQVEEMVEVKCPDVRSSNEKADFYEESKTTGLTMLLAGSGTISLGNQEFQPEINGISQITARKCNVAGRCISVINMLGFWDAELFQNVDWQQHHVSLCKHEIHAFLLVVPLGQIIGSCGLEWLLATFGERALEFTIIIFTYDEKRDDTVVDDLKGNTVLEYLVDQCGRRYHTCHQSSNNAAEVTELLKKIDAMLLENAQHCYTIDIYNVEKTEKQQQEPHAEHTGKSEEEKPSADRIGHSSNNEDITVEGKGTQVRAEQAESQKSEGTRCKSLEVRELLSRLQLPNKLTTKDVLQIDPASLQQQQPQTEQDLAYAFLQRLLMMDYRARYMTISDENNKACSETPTIMPEIKDTQKSAFNVLFSKSGSDGKSSEKNCIHPMDVQMAVFDCADHFLKLYMITKLSLCQYALPLIIPNPITLELECPLWTLRQITKSWKSFDDSGVVTSKTLPICKAPLPVVSVFRFGSLSSSKSLLLNGLINQRHNTFFHRHCPGSSRKRLLMDGVVEIAWYCPSGKNTDNFKECVMFCNLRGDAEENELQRKFLIENASVTVVFLSNLTQDDKALPIVEQLFNSSKPLICLFDDDDSAVTEVSEGKYKIGVKNRNQSDIINELTKTIRESLSKPFQAIKLEDALWKSGFRVDENEEDCIKGKACADSLMERMKATELFKIKKEFLPCQGKLWHEWSQKMKDLHRLHGDIEKHKSKTEQEMRTIRKKQRDAGLSGLMESFITNLASLDSNQRAYFLKWLGLLLDDRSLDTLSELHHQYNQMWSKLLALKKDHMTKELEMEQKKLEHIAEELNEATFGIEHLLRETGQIYEASIGQKRQITINGKERNISLLPQLAAELLISGYPIELMDGDAAHVPLSWIDAVLDEVICQLGDKRIFVLSVLGLQSTGKSTMLNAMFGLQFAVGAGRCTRGAFMQFVELSEEMKREQKFDYVLVVDTEGLRALELAGKETLHHDNELATFVIGLGDITLINIFGENPAEMQDILQIAVQAFFRMKKVKLSPSCVFVHQNVGDITAKEKNMEGKRHLQKKLDTMTRLAAKEEEYDAESFTDVIAFDVSRDVQYFAQLWEGSPPMAPPNPCYSENIQDLKQTIFSYTSKSKGKELSQFKIRVHDLWNALLNENFVFSFKNTVEIAAYRKLEVEYGKWTWTLRRAMLMTENKLHHRIKNEKLDRALETFIVEELRESYENVQKMMLQYFEENQDKEVLIQWKGRFICKISELHDDLVKGTKRKFDEVIQQKEACKKVDKKRAQYESELFNKSKELALKLKDMNSEAESEKEFNSMWEVWVSELTQGMTSIKDINVGDDVLCILSEDNESGLVHSEKNSKSYRKILSLGDYSQYVTLKKPYDHRDTDKHFETSSAGQNILGRCDTIYQNIKQKVADLFPWKKNKCLESPMSENVLTPEDQDQIRGLLKNIVKEMEAFINKTPIATMGYNDSYIQEIKNSVKQNVRDFESKHSKFWFKKELIINLLLHVCEIAERVYTAFHSEFKGKNDAQLYLANLKPQYYNIFRHYCQGATSTAVFAELICTKLKESIRQAVYDKTAIDIAGEIRANCPAFSGNRSNLEMHILRSLANQEDFDKFMEYIHNPQKHFENFVKDNVKKYLYTKNTSKILPLIRQNVEQKHQCLNNATAKATEHTKKSNGDVNMWLKLFSKELTDELTFAENCINGVNPQEITDFDFLEKILKESLDAAVRLVYEEFLVKSTIRMKEFRVRPDKILIKQLCECCWVQCPFCKAICTNTMKDHDGDHQVPFHRTNGINGWIYRGTNHLCINFCTTAVASDMKFYPSFQDNELFWYKKYREAGPNYACWSITPDNSELPYWKWFVCRFQSDLEAYYNRKFQGHGEIPKAWRAFTKEQALGSLDNLS